MKVAHFAPFAPRACGLYEAARDFVLADQLAGRSAIFVDVGSVGDGGAYQPPRPGAEDVRRSWTLRVSPQDEALSADLWVVHNCINDRAFSARAGQPMVWVLHGRPVDCFRPEFWRRGAASYSTYAEVAAWPRVRRLLTLWPEHAPLWAPIVPAGKLAVLPAPPIDQDLYSPDGPVHEFAPEHRGEFHVLIADSWREDDPYYLVHGVALAARKIPGLRLHLYSCEQPSGPWDHLYRHLRGLGVLGETRGRMGDMDHLYRAVDLVLTHNFSVSRIVAEALSCGTAVLAAAPNAFATFTYPAQHDAYGVRDALIFARRQLADADCGLSGPVIRPAEAFCPRRFGAALGPVYAAALGKEKLEAADG
ncbi:MAG: hypothetical protein ABIL09_17465 [Gemmatimonadota bacterium]